MSEIFTQIIINASITDVWAKLIHFSAYKEWNPFICDIKGDARLGERLIVTIKPPGKKEMIFKPKIISLIPEYEFKWQGHLFIPGVFDGLHQFQLNKQTDNKVQLIHSERFSGILKTPIFKMIQTATQHGFLQMNAALKKHCEAKTHT